MGSYKATCRKQRPRIQYVSYQDVATCNSPIISYAAVFSYQSDFGFIRCLTFFMHHYRLGCVCKKRESASNLWNSLSTDM